MNAACGTLHRHIPREVRANLRFRRRLLKESEASAEVRAALVEACRADVLFYINAFVWQFNPTRKGKEIGPFITWDFQEEAVGVIIDCIDKDDDLLIEKSRDMGASWLLLIIFDWLARFHPWKKFLAISRNEDAVESDDPDSLFWKVDHIHEQQPGWLLRPTERKDKFFGYASRSTFTGQASTGKAGVGGRATAMLIDEFSQIREDYEVLHRTSDTSKCRIFNGTHTGLDKAFYELSQRVDLRKLQMHWSQHPLKNRGLYRWDAEAQQVEVIDKAFAFPEDFQFVTDGTPTGGPFPGLRSPWYDRQCKRKGSPRAIAQDLDIDPKGSVSQFFDPLLIRALVGQFCYEPVWEGDLFVDKDTGRPIELVQGKGGPLKLWLNLRHNGLPPPGQYGIGGDLAAGTGATPSCLSVTDSTTGEKVAEYTNAHILPERLAPVATGLAWLFKTHDGEPAMLGWECPGPGLVFGKCVIDLGFRRIYYRTREDRVTKVSTDSWGWHSNPDAKRTLLEEYRAALMNRRYLNRSRPAMEECLAYKYTPKGTVEHGGEASVNDPTGARVNHGDHVIADALSHRMCTIIGQPQASGATQAVRPGSLAWRRQLADTSDRADSGWQD